MKTIVYNADSRTCMLHKCEACRGKEALLFIICKIGLLTWKAVIRLFFNNGDQLTEAILNILTWRLEFLFNIIDKLTLHSYISKYQSRYLKQLNNYLNAKKSVCIVLTNFFENYTMTVQDEIQSFLFYTLQSTLHPTTTKTNLQLFFNKG